MKGFKKSCKSSAAEETDEDVLWNGSEEHGNVTNECEEDGGTDCEDGDSDRWIECDTLCVLSEWH